MRGIVKKLAFAFIALLLALGSSHLCLANAAEPPSILIIVPNAPKDLEIKLEPGDIQANRTDKAIESYFTFRRADLKTGSSYTLKIAAQGKSFEIALNSPLQTYNNVFTLDLAHQRLAPGKSLSRSVALPALRISLTLLIEGLVFWLFGYRTRRSWLVFILANLATQLFLNLTLLADVQLPAYGGYLILGLIFLEILITLVELAVFLIFVNEKPRWLTLLYVLAANLLSLFVGGFLITQLPV